MTAGDGEDICSGDDSDPSTAGTDTCNGGAPGPPGVNTPDPDACDDDIESASGCFWKGQNV